MTHQCDKHRGFRTSGYIVSAFIFSGLVFLFFVVRIMDTQSPASRTTQVKTSRTERGEKEDRGKVCPSISKSKKLSVAWIRFILTSFPLVIDLSRITRRIGVHDIKRSEDSVFSSLPSTTHLPVSLC